MEKIYRALAKIKENFEASGKIEIQMEGENLKIKIGWINPDISMSRSDNLLITKDEIENGAPKAILRDFLYQCTKQP